MTLHPHPRKLGCLLFVIPLSQRPDDRIVDLHTYQPRTDCNAGDDDQPGRDMKDERDLQCGLAIPACRSPGFLWRFGPDRGLRLCRGLGRPGYADRLTTRWAANNGSQLGLLGREGSSAVGAGQCERHFGSSSSVLTCTSTVYHGDRRAIHEIAGCQEVCPQIIDGRTQGVYTLLKPGALRC